MLGLSSLSTTASSAAQAKLNTALQALSSGNRIGSAAIDPAGMAQSASYSVQLSSTAQAMNNVQDGVSVLETAGGAMSQISQNLQDIRSLAVQAGDGALNPSDLQSIQQQIGQLSQGIGQIAGSTQFNGQNLLDGSANLSIQTGSAAGQSQNLTLGNMSSSALGLSGIDITTATGQVNTLTALDNAIQQVNSQQANVGAMQSGLSTTASNLGVSYENLAAANSRVSDTDYAKTTSDLAQANVQNQASLRALAMYNANQKSVLSLLPT